MGVHFPSIPRCPRVGYGGYGQLGNGNVTDISIPMPVAATAGVNSGWAAVSAGGGFHTCAIAESTRATYCWGACGAVVPTRSHPSKMTMQLDMMIPSHPLVLHVRRA